MQGLTGRVFQLRVGYGSGIGKNISGRIGYGLGTGIGIIYRANRVLSGIEKLDRVFFGYFFHVTYILIGMLLGFCGLPFCGSLSIESIYCLKVQIL